MRITLYILFLGLVFVAQAQPSLQITELAPMPAPVANNAVVAATVLGQQYVYSFGGIGPALNYAAITQRAFRYTVATDTWDTLPPLPDTLGKIAAAASFVNGKIYIIGGYHVLPNGDEISSNKVHIFDPQTNTYLPDGAPVPVPIDDQVQAVWRDSLIYVVAGWSNSGHVTNVQIYNPTTNTWAVGSPIPNTIDYKAFGASGVFVGDTLYYMGGARTGLSFPATPELRKGAINPANPTQIGWSYSIYYNTAGYRMGVGTLGNWAVWVGGAATTYNFNASAYDGSGVVQPENRILLYNPAEDTIYIYTDTLPLPFMDLRGTGQLSAGRFVVCGGMLDNATVSNRVFLFEDPTITAVASRPALPMAQVYPNPAKEVLYINSYEAGWATVIDLLGKAYLPPVKITSGQASAITLPNGLPSGLYLLQLRTQSGVQTIKILVE